MPTQVRPMRPLPLAAALMLLTAFGASRPALAADNATATATAVVLQPIAVSKNNDMVFGSVVGGNGDVTVATNSARTNANATTAPVLPSGGSTPAAARFDVTGTGNYTFSIDYTGSSSQLSDGSGNNMNVAWIAEALGTTSPTNKTSGTDATGTLNSGAAYIYVGGTLNVGAAQVAGTYTGTIKVTVAYN